MAKEELDLLQFPTRFATKLRAGSPKIIGRQVVVQSNTFDELPNRMIVGTPRARGGQAAQHLGF